MDSKLKILLGIAVAALIGLIAYKTLSGTPSEKKLAVLTNRYKQAGGFGLGRELAAKFPNAKVLALVPGQDQPNWQIYEGFKIGAGTGLTIVEAAEQDLPVAAKGLQAKLAEKRKATNDGHVMKQPVTAGGIADAIAKKGDGCTVLVSFLGLPVKNGRQGESMDTCPGIEKMKVAAFMGTLPAWLKPQMKKGQVVAVITPTSAIYTWPKDEGNEKLFQTCWKLVTPTTVETDIR